MQLHRQPPAAATINWLASPGTPSLALLSHNPLPTRHPQFSYVFDQSLDAYNDYVIAQFPHGAQWG